MLRRSVKLARAHADALGFQELQVQALQQVVRAQVLPEQALRVGLLQGPAHSEHRHAAMHSGPVRLQLRRDGVSGLEKHLLVRVSPLHARVDESPLCRGGDGPFHCLPPLRSSRVAPFSERDSTPDLNFRRLNFSKNYSLPFLQ